MAASKKTSLKSVGAKSARAAKRVPATATADSAPSSPAKRGRPARARAHLLSSKLSYKGPVFSVYTDKVREPNGKVAVRDVIHHSGSIVILAVEETKRRNNPEVILIRQYRHAAGRYLLELPAGRIEPGERSLASAKREMIEETGFRARRWTPLTRYFASPGFLGEWMQIYLAEDLTAGEAAPEGDEDIEVVRLPLVEAMQLVAQNKIQDGKTLVGLSLFAAMRKSQPKSP